jgi:hypothetical protein
MPEEIGSSRKFMANFYQQNYQDKAYEYFIISKNLGEIRNLS